MRYTSIAITLACLLGTTTANAGWLSGSVASDTPQSRHAYQRTIVGQRGAVYDRGQIVAHPVGCPHYLFCGCGTALKVFGRPIRDLWLVANWYRFPRATPAAGRVVLWGRRHVAYIMAAYGDGTATLYDPNSGNGLTRVHRVSIAGLTVVDPR